MSLSTGHAQWCGPTPAIGDVAVIETREPAHTAWMTILPRLISIAVKKYAANPNDRQPAVRMLLRNAVRLAVSHLGKEQSASIVFEALQEPPQ